MNHGITTNKPKKFWKNAIWNGWRSAETKRTSAWRTVRPNVDTKTNPIPRVFPESAARRNDVVEEIWNALVNANSINS